MQSSLLNQILLTSTIVFVWSEEKGRQQNKGPFSARVNIMWEEKLVDPPMDYITSVNVPYPQY